MRALQRTVVLAMSMAALSVLFLATILLELLELVSRGRHRVDPS